MPIGLTVPFSQATGSLGFLASTETMIEATRQNIKSLLLTNWGERPMHFHMGCNFIEFLFEPMRSPDLRQKMSDRIVQQLATWLPFVKLLDLKIRFREDDLAVPENGVGIFMKFNLIGNPTNFSSVDVVVPGP